MDDYFLKRITCNLLNLGSNLGRSSYNVTFCQSRVNRMRIALVRCLYPRMLFIQCGRFLDSQFFPVYL